MIRISKVIFTALIGCFAPFFLVAQDIPSVEEAQKVLDFYYNGKGNGIVLVESKICRDIYKEGNNKYECKDDLIEFGEIKDTNSAPESFHKIQNGEAIYVWMNYLVPMGAEEKIFLNYNLDGVTRRVSSKYSVKGALRYRTWSKFTPPSKGDWEIKIFFDSEDNPTELTTMKLTVE